MPALVAVSTAFQDSDAGTATYPAGVQDGDTILIHATTATNQVFTMTDPGWTQIGHVSSGNVDGTYSATTVLSSVYNAASPLSLAYPDPGNHVVGVVTAWRGFRASPVGATSTSFSNGLSTAHTATGPTTTVSDAFVVLTASHGDIISSATFSSHGNLDASPTTIASESTALGNDGHLLVAYGTQAAPGAVGGLTWGTPESRRMSAVVVELRPLAATPTTSVFLSDGAGGSIPMSMSFATGAGTAPLSAPQNLTATSTGATSIGLTCDEPASDGGSPILAYEWEQSLNGTTWTSIGATTSRSRNVTGLTASTLYYFRVRADNGTLGPFSSIASATTGSGSVTTVPLADITGFHCELNIGTDHATKFGSYCTTFGFTLSSVLLGLSKAGASTMVGNANAARGYWETWVASNPTVKPDHMDVITPLGFANTGRTTTQELEHVLSGGYDSSYQTTFTHLKGIADLGIIIVARIGNEPNLIAQPWAMLDVPEAKRDLYGKAFDHVARIGKSIMPNMIAGYCPNHTATQTVGEYVRWAGGPSYHLDDDTIIYDWPLNRPEGMKEVGAYEFDAYMGNKTATQLVADLEYVKTLAIRDGKVMAVPEWGMPDNKGTTLAQAVPRLQEMCDEFRALGDRLIFQQYFGDKPPWELDDWQGVNLLDDYVAIVLNDPA